MIYEHIYDRMLRLTRKAKKRYLTKALEHEETEHLKSIDLEGWSMKDRQETYQQEVLP